MSDQPVTYTVGEPVTIADRTGADGLWKCRRCRFTVIDLSDDPQSPGKRAMINHYKTVHMAGTST